MKGPFKRGSGNDPQKRPEPPPLTENVYEDFRAVEQNLRRYVDYRLADLAPLDGTFYRRRRVEIWSVLIILTLLATTAYETWTKSSPQSTVTSQEGSETGKPEAPERPQPTTPDSPAEPEPTTEQKGDTGEATSESKQPLPFNLTWEKIRADPNDSWALYLKSIDGDKKELVLDYMNAIAEGRDLDADDRVSPRQKSNFKQWRPILEEGKEINTVNILLGVFEYLLIRRQMEQGYQLEPKTPRIELSVTAKEYPPALIEGYLKDLSLEGDFGGRAVDNRALQVATVISEIERGTRP